MSGSQSYPNWPSSNSDVFFPSSDPSSSGFQVNPGSQLPRHPRSPPLSPSRSTATGHGGVGVGVGLPGSSTRTPRTSTHIPLTPSTKLIKANNWNFDDDDDDSEKDEKEKKELPRKEEVWREIFETAYGRDKAFKLIQYSLKVYLMFHVRSTAYLRHPRGGQLINRIQSTIKGLSLTRKCIIMFNWLSPLHQIMHPSQESLPFHQKKKSSKGQSSLSLTSPTIMHRFLHAPPPLLLDLVGAISQDVYTLSTLGMVGKRIGDRAERITNWAWFCSTLAGLVEVNAEQTMVKGLMSQVEERLYNLTMGDMTESRMVDTSADDAELERLRKQYGWLQVSQTKLMMDLVFVSYDLFHIKRAREFMMAMSGLLSAVLSTAKVYDKHQAGLMKVNDV